MPLELYLAFVAATAILVAIPGPNVALVVANSVAYGRAFGLLTVAGTTTAALLPQLVFISLGMTGSLVVASWFSDLIRWAGVAYLFYLGVRNWSAPGYNLTCVIPEPRTARTIFTRGVLVSLTNPKSWMFYAAFFPQFVTPGPHLFRQMLLLSATFLTIAAIHDCAWALAADRLRSLLAARGSLRNRVIGSVYLAAALALAVMRAT